MKVILGALLAFALSVGSALAATEVFVVEAVRTNDAETQAFHGGEFGSTTKVQFPTVYTNQNTRFSTLTNDYTVATDGIYEFAVDVSLLRSNTYGECTFGLSFWVLNVAPFAQEVSKQFLPAASSDQQAVHLSGSMIRKLKAGAKVSAQLTASPDCDAVIDAPHGAHFAGFKN